MHLAAEYTALPSISHIFGRPGWTWYQQNSRVSQPPRALPLLQTYKLGGDCGIEPQCGLRTLTVISIVLLFIELIVRKNGRRDWIWTSVNLAAYRLSADCSNQAELHAENGTRLESRTLHNLLVTQAPTPVETTSINCIRRKARTILPIEPNLMGLEVMTLIAV